MVVKSREKYLSFLSKVRSITGLSYSSIAKKAGLSDSTITRFINKENMQRLSTETLDSISKVAGYESYEHYLLSEHKTSQSPIIDDMLKLEIYDMSKILLEKRYGVTKHDITKFITKDVISSMEKMNTTYLSESLIMYVIEKNKSKIQKFLP
jgi:transcriptional regulator with XRE-family HTH domain